jgi:hypothetical protein
VQLLHYWEEKPMLRRFALLLIILSAICGRPPVARALTVGGAVSHQLNLGMDDLARFATTEVRLTDFTRKKEFNGVFVYQAVPLRAILQLAGIRKEEGGFNKPIDLAILVRNRKGESALLSWGEIFYRNPSNVTLAISAVPVMPHRTDSCVKCHGPEVYQPALDKLKRKVGLPKLILSNDFFSDRSLEEIESIEVVDLKRGVGKKPAQVPSVSSLSVVDSSGKIRNIGDLADYRQISVEFKNVGDGRGFHGYRQFRGVPLRDLLGGIEGEGDRDLAVLVTSTDGYQGLLSFGEIFLAPLGERIIVSEKKGKTPGSREYTLIVPDDLAADRMIKTVSRIEVVPVRSKNRTPMR